MSQQQPSTVTFYCHATAEVVPGPQARGNAVKDILGYLAQRHGEFLLLFFSLEPNEISVPHPAVAK